MPLANYSLVRFGHPHDGGYLMCANLLTGVCVAYSYGIDGRDDWGCDIGRALGVAVHEYDCFVGTRPVCPNARLVFHAECIGQTGTDARFRAFDILERQLARNGAHGVCLAVEMDIEGAEWRVLLETPAEVLVKIDQLVVESHGFDEVHFESTLRRLKRFFVVAHAYFNDHSCVSGAQPLPSLVYDVLLINRELAAVDPLPSWARGATAPDSPNRPDLPDCQVSW
ncbi:MAG TPA: hypothetical protein PLE61_00005 [Vicinamibacterales bacterium]|nr:hypothetical protein [Vicinamibacterales bacterium]